MYAVCVTFHIRDGEMQKFLVRMRQQARESLANEPGCHRFDICGDDAAPDEVFLYELYTDKAAFALHNESVHLKAFSTDVNNLVADKKVSTFGTVDIGQSL